MIRLVGLDVSATAEGPQRPWRRMDLVTQNHLTAANRADAVKVLELGYGPRVKGTLRTIAHTGHRQCEFRREFDGYTIYTKASWFEEKA